MIRLSSVSDRRTDWLRKRHFDGLSGHQRGEGILYEVRDRLLLRSRAAGAVIDRAIVGDGALPINDENVRCALGPVEPGDGAGGILEYGVVQVEGLDEFAVLFRRLIAAAIDPQPDDALFLVLPGQLLWDLPVIVLFGDGAFRVDPLQDHDLPCMVCQAHCLAVGSVQSELRRLATRPVYDLSILDPPHDRPVSTQTTLHALHPALVFLGLLFNQGIQACDRLAGLFPIGNGVDLTQRVH